MNPVSPFKFPQPQPPTIQPPSITVQGSVLPWIGPNFDIGYAPSGSNRSFTATVNRVGFTANANSKSNNKTITAIADSSQGGYLGIRITKEF
jgi:hypothetical protein